MIRYNNKIIIGVDMGNFNIKTANMCFPSAFTELTGDGNNYPHTLRYDGKDYALGGKRVAQRDDKAAANDDFLILTLFAVAMELETNNCAPGSYDIYLSATLPPAYLNNKEMRSNLKQFFRRQAAFQYNGRRYKINIVKVYVCPQGISAMYANISTDHMKKLSAGDTRPIDLLVKEPVAILIDIGGGTVDPVIMKYGIPEPFEDENPARGVIWTYNRVRGDIKAKYGTNISEDAVNMFLSGENIRINEPCITIIKEHMLKYADRLFLEMHEKGLPFSNAYTIVQGGGAEMVRNIWGSRSNFAMLDFLTEIKATAIGSEIMAQRMMMQAELKQESRVS